MPLTNPGREGLEGGQTVFIDGPLELPSQLTHQELENLVGLTDLDALQDASHNQIIDTADVLLTDEMEHMDESNTDIAMDTSDHDANHSMDVDCLNNSTSSIAAQLSNLVPLEMTLDDSTTSQISTSSIIQKSATELPLNMLNTSIAQPMKPNSNQFVILQPTQNFQNSSFISLGGKLVPTGQLLSINSTANNNKPTVNNLQSNPKPAFTKLIINSQPGSIQPSRGVTPQNNVLSGDGIIKIANKNSPSKMAFQFQPIGSPVGQRQVFQSIPKIVENKPSPQLSVPLSFAIRPMSTVIKQEPSEHLIQGTTSTATASSSPQKIFIKGAMPLSSLKTGQIIGDSHFIKFPSNQICQSQGLQTSNKVNYVRLVSQSPIDSSTNTTSTLSQFGPRVVNIKKQIVPMSNHSGLSIKALSVAGNTITSNNTVSSFQMRPPGTLTVPASALPQQVLSNAQPGSLVMIPAHLLQNNNTTCESSSSIIQVASQLSPTLPNVAKPQPTKTMIDANGIKSRKPCNCTKSQCLKLYCDCFANGEFCNNCNCNNCFNNLKHEEDRQKAIRSCLERNPQAFRPKIGKGGMENKRRHNKGCNCKRSGCLKNYCECYEAKIPCSRICKCVGCRNVDNCQNLERKRLLEIAEATEAKVNHKIYIQNKAISLSSMPSPAKMMYPSSGKSTHCRINQEVVAATCHCLLAQAEKGCRTGVEETEKQLMVINEFSRCLLQIVGCTVNKSKD